jgi:hypothetical protein
VKTLLARLAGSSLLITDNQFRQTQNNLRSTMREVWLGSTRTGKLIQKVEATGESSFKINVQGDDVAEVIIPLSEIPAEHRANLAGFLKDNERFMVELTYPFINGEKVHALPIENLAVDNDKATVSAHCMGINGILGRIPALPSNKRAAIESDAEEWTVTGTPAYVVGQFISQSVSEFGSYKFPQSIKAAVGGGNTVITHTLKLSELNSIKDITDSLAASYEGFETVYEAQIVLSPEPHVEWTPVIGNPHYRKTEPPLAINIDQRGDGQTSFSATKNGREHTNWWWTKSTATDETNEHYIDLKSAVKTPPAGDEEYLTLFNKEFFNSALTPAEQAEQRSARMSVVDIPYETFNISVFDTEMKYPFNMGRRLNVTATKRLTGLNKELRITGVDWNHKSPMMTLTVMPAALRVFPKVPNRLSDVIKRETEKARNEAKWTQPKPPTGSGGGIPVVDPWTKPVGSEHKPAESDVMQSPLTRIKYLDNQQANGLAGLGGDGVNQFSGPIWGTDKFATLKNQAHGNMLTDSSTTVPNASQQRFYGLAWSAQMTKTPDITRDIPLPAELFKTRKFVAFPTWSYAANGNPGGPLTDASWGFSGQGGLVGTVSSAFISAQMLDDIGPGEMKFERLATGLFFRGAGNEQKAVIYFHQLQVFDNGDGNSQIRSKGFAFEGLIDAETGDLNGGWTTTPYPFEVAGSDKTYYPETAQVESYGPELSIVTCLTPAAYWRDNDMPVAYPAIVSNTYWTRMQMGKYAIENISITKNYRTGKTYQTEGHKIGVFRTLDNTDERWNEKYQIVQYRGELWATNITRSSYYSETKEGVNKFFRFTLKSQIDKDGKPVEWLVAAGQAGYSSGGSWGEYDEVVLYPLVGLGEYVFSGSADGEYDIPDGFYSRILATKTGFMGGKIMYGIVPDNSSRTFYEANNASGRTNGPKEFFPDFYDFSLNGYGAVPSGGGQATWMSIPIDEDIEGIIPIWNGTADNFFANEIVHGITSMKSLNVADWVVVPPATNSYLMGSGSGGYGQWFWYGL